MTIVYVHKMNNRKKHPSFHKRSLHTWSWVHGCVRILFCNTCIFLMSIVAYFILSLCTHAETFYSKRVGNEMNRWLREFIVFQFGQIKTSWLINTDRSLFVDISHEVLIWKTMNSLNHLLILFPTLLPQNISACPLSLLA